MNWSIIFKLRIGSISSSTFLRSLNRCNFSFSSWKEFLFRGWCSFGYESSCSEDGSVFDKLKSSLIILFYFFEAGWTMLNNSDSYSSYCLSSSKRFNFYFYSFYFISFCFSSSFFILITIENVSFILFVASNKFFCFCYSA